MTFKTNTLRHRFLLTAATAAGVAAMAVPALAAPTVLPSGVTIPEGVPQSQGPGETTQLRFPDGTIVSFVGEADYTVQDDGTIIVRDGNVTVMSGSGLFTVQTSNGDIIDVSGGAAVTVANGAPTSHVLGGTTTVRSGGTERSYTSGQAWSSNGNGARRTVAAGVQAVTPVKDLKQGGVLAAAENGIPIALGEALAALGASADIVKAAQSLDAARTGAADLNVLAIPANVEALLNFQDAIAQRFNNPAAFQGGSPEIIDAYLRFLAGGGQIAEFQAVYANLVTTYLELLSTGGFATDFQGLGLLDVQAYLTYLETIGALGRLGEGQQGLIADYLAFLRGGGDPARFIPANVTLSADIIELYQSAISDYISFIVSGGVPSEFEGLSQDILSRYIQLLTSSGLLESIFGAQAEVLRAYAEFLEAGGVADEFSGLASFGLSDELAVQYTEALQSLIATLVDGGTLADLTIPSESLVTFIDALERAGLLEEAFAAQREILLAFSTFVADGGVASAFDGFNTLALSDTAAAELQASVNALIAVFSAGGSFADFTGDIDAVLAAIERLNGAGDLSELFGAALAAQLEAFAQFVEAGGIPSAFAGFTAIPLSDAAQADLAATISQFIAALASGTEFADLQDEYLAFIAALTRLTDTGALADVFGAQVDLINQLFSLLAMGGDLGSFDFTGLINAGGGVVGGGGMGSGPAPIAGTRSTQNVVYAGPIGIDSRDPTTVTYGANGGPTAYTWDLTAATAQDERPEIGSATLVEAGGIGDVLGWGRWTNGTTAGNYPAAGTVDIPEDGGWHILGGTAATNLPTTGRVDYDLIGNTSPTRRDGGVAPGTLNTAEAAVEFGAISRVGVELGFSIGGEDYGISSFGGVDNLAQGIQLRPDQEGNVVRFNANIFANNIIGSGGSLCDGARPQCNASLTGFLAGDGAPYLGLAYSLGNVGDDMRVDGVAAFGIEGANAGGGDTGGDTGGNTGGDAAMGAVRTDQFVAYTSSVIGVDQRRPATVTYDEATGAPIAYIWEREEMGERPEQPTIGDATLNDAGSVGTVVGWGRWAGGLTGGRFYNLRNGVELPEDGGWHVITGTPATNVPTSGTIQYELVGSTAPTRRDGAVAPGTLDSARAAIAFGTQSRLGVEMDLTIGGEGYNVTTVGGADDPSQGLTIGEPSFLTDVGFRGDSFDGSASASGGSLCNGASQGCNATITGFLAGEGASHIALAYTFGATFDQQVDGTAAFAQAGSGATASAATSATDWSRWGDLDTLAVTADPQVGAGLPSPVDAGDLGEQGVAVPSWISFR